MESYVPPILPPERAPDNEPDQPKPRWNVFELFKKAEAAAKNPELAATQAPEQAPERPALQPEHRKFAAKVIELLRAPQAAAPAYEAAVLEEDAVIAIDRAPSALQAEVAAMREVKGTETVQFIERAKEMGRGVLRLIGQVRQEVNQADHYEHATHDTNLEPLAIADADVRAAMEELVAPIEAITVHDVTPGDAIETAVQVGGGDREFGFLNELKSPFVRSLEVAASVASIAAREALDVKEKVLTHTTAIRKVGLFALGAATTGGFVYTWNRIRDIKKEQRELRRERKRFEAEVREVQAREERRLQEFEASSVQGMTQPERQQYVQEVSDFAHARAEEIRTTARMREVIQAPSAPESAPAPERPEAPQQERPVMQAEKASVMEQIGARLDAAKDSAGTAMGSAVAAGMALLQGRQAQPDDTVQQSVPTRQSAQKLKQSSGQAWLWGAMLAIAVVIFVFLLSLRIL